MLHLNLGKADSLSREGYQQRAVVRELGHMEPRDDLHAYPEVSQTEFQFVLRVSDLRSLLFLQLCSDGGGDIPGERLPRGQG